uniref:Tyrosine specific protein phosphatases domain-containing protein n=1 Tax=Arcella intermedia TaxID=1963864 RepID=A0A6B2KYF4_9EUKA
MGYLDLSDSKNVVFHTNKSEVDLIREQMKKSKDCRTRSRFPVPVLTINNKNICRSAGLAEKAEMMYKKAKNTDIKGILQKGITASKYSARILDKEWLRILKIKYIIDLMNEKTRSFMGVVPLCSGEVGSRYYGNFAINTMPFPGVNTYKGFKEDRKQGLPVPEGRRVKDNEGGAVLVLTEREYFSLYSWEDKPKDVVTLIRYYMRYLFYLLKNGENGLLVHCISGWDRTPMFIGILRILLWAEGLAHKSLDAKQILYLVIGYDWLLFGHQLLSRLKEGSQILYFSFWVLQYLLDEDFSIQGADTKVAENNDVKVEENENDSSNSTLPPVDEKETENATNDTKETMNTPPLVEDSPKLKTYPILRNPPPDLNLNATGRFVLKPPATANTTDELLQFLENPEFDTKKKLKIKGTEEQETRPSWRKGFCKPDSKDPIASLLSPRRMTGMNRLSNLRVDSPEVVTPPTQKYLSISEQSPLTFIDESNTVTFEEEEQKSQKNLMDLLPPEFSPLVSPKTESASADTSPRSCSTPKDVPQNTSQSKWKSCSSAASSTDSLNSILTSSVPMPESDSSNERFFESDSEKPADPLFGIKKSRTLKGTKTNETSDEEDTKTPLSASTRKKFPFKRKEEKGSFKNSPEDNPTGEKKAESSLPPPLKPATDRQLKILSVWDKFNEMYSLTMEHWHTKANSK